MKKMRYITICLLTLIAMSCQTKMAVIKQNDKYGLINSKGKIIVKPHFDDILGKREGFYVVKLDSVWGYMDRKGKVIIKPQYRDADFFNEGFACVGNVNKKYGFINTKGDTVIDFKYDDSFGGFSNGLADVSINGSCGYINKKGEIVIPLIYKTCYPFLCYFAVVWTFDGEQILVNKNGKTFVYDEKKYINKRLWSLNTYPGAFETKNGRGRLNQKGDTIIPPNYLIIGNLSNGMYIVQDKNGKWGAFNDKGKLIIKPQFDDMWHFYDGISNFCLNKKWGYINKKGEIVIKPKFDYAAQFNRGLAYVEFNGKAGFINKNGEIVIPIIYEPYRMARFE